MKNIRRGFTMWKKEGVRYLVVPSFEKAGGVLCALATRIGGVSPKPYDTLNFSRSRENDETNFQENMRRFGIAAGFDKNKAVGSRYEHGVSLYRSSTKDAGRGIILPELDYFCDGLYTNETGLPLITYHADCVPLIFYDPKARAAAICHAGWRGVVGHIIPNAVQAMQGLGCRPQDILTAVGPCISVAHFEVQQDVSRPFFEAFGDEVVEVRDGRTYVDLPKACAIDMMKTGILPESITLSDLCTYENKRLFFSHRREQGKTGAMAAVIELKS